MRGNNVSVMEKYLFIVNLWFKRDRGICIYLAAFGFVNFDRTKKKQSLVQKPTIGICLVY